jgi:cell division protein FtsL
MKDNVYIDKDSIPEVPKKPEPKKKKEPTKKSRPSSLVQIMNGDFLTKEFMLNNLNFIFFIIFLLLLLVAKGYYGKQLSKDAEKAQMELNELNSNYVETKTKLEEETRRYKLIEKLSPVGLNETVNPTKVIRIKKNNKDK